MQINTQIGADHCKKIAQQLHHLLADTYALYLKTQNFHWNVKGPTFMMLHLLLEKQYEELAEAVDEIAERIRALGFPVSAGFEQFKKQAQVQIPEGCENLKAEEMLKQLLSDHETTIKTVRAIYPLIEAGDDKGTEDLAARRLLAHEEAAWMLRSTLES